MNLKKYFPASRYFDDYANNEFKECYTSVIAQCYHKMKIEKKPGIILFIDEVDKFGMRQITKLQKLLLEILNNSVKTINDKYLNLNFDPRNILVVLASNKSLLELNSKYSPLMTRFVQIKFPAISKEIKNKILTKYMDKEMKDIGENIDYLTDKEIQFINEIIEDSTKDGVRELIRYVGLYVNHFKSNKFYKGTLWEDNEKFNIKIYNISEVPENNVKNDVVKNVFKNDTEIDDFSDDFSDDGEHY